MIVALATLALAPQADFPAPVISPSPKHVLTQHIASVRFDCVMGNKNGESIRLSFERRGRQIVVGDYSQRDAETLEPQLADIDYRIMEKSDERFADAKEFMPGGRSTSPSIGSVGDVAFLNSEGTPVALFRFPDPYSASDGVPIVAFLPRTTDSSSLETLAGVCSRTRLEDQPR